MALVFLQSLFIALPALAAAQSTLNPIVLCVPGQCVQGYSNITLGGKLLSSSVSPIPIHLLPGQYTSATNPEFLHNALTSSSTTLQSSAGVNSTLSLPLDLELQPGLATFSDRLYAGQTAFTSLPNAPLPNNNSSTPLDTQSFVISSDVVVITTAASSSNRVILWDSVPDTQNLPSPLNSAQFSLVDILSTTCAPVCSSGGICNPQGQCVCQTGFTGQACESCASGFFGPSCQKCPGNCTQCDEGISGTGRCLTPSGGNSCNCLNGACNSDGSCQCNSGFTKANNGTQCAQCTSGFFLTTTGDCKICQVGCTQCADGTGACLSCKSGFSQDQSDPTKCDPVPQVTSTGTTCPQLAFANGASCQPCASPCQSCSGATSNDCTACVEGQYMLNGVCVEANSDGVCEGTNLIADNNKKACDACGAKCTACKIQNFSIASLASQAQCTGCIPGTFLSNGTCVDACPSGTFVSPQDNMSCLPCNSSCGTCSGSASLCLTCSNSNQLAFNGTCLAASSCPQNTFANPSTSSCLSCHPDCASCSGSSFNQCTICPPSRPVLSNGRCMPTCSKNQFWDPSANSCQSCDSSCGSCAGPGSSSCLSCSNANSFVLRSGSCVTSSQACTSSANTTTVINPLGVCLSELITIPSGTSSLSPMPTITGIDEPTTIVKGRKLQWWQILLMTLGCAFIFVVIIWCCRRRCRKRKEEERRRIHAYAFANTVKKPWWRCGGKRDRKHTAQPYHPDLDIDETIHTGSPSKDKNSWKWRLIRFGEKFFGHSKSTRIYPMEMGRTTRSGKDIALLSDPSPHSRKASDAKIYHYHSRSQFDGTRSSDDRDRDSYAIDHRTPPRPERLRDVHLLDVPVDVQTAETHFDDSPVARYAKHHRDRDTLPPRGSLAPGSAPQSQKQGHDRLSPDNDRDKEGEEDMVQLISSYRYSVDPKTPPATKASHFHHGSRSRTSTPSNDSRTQLLVQPYRDAQRHDQKYQDDDEYYNNRSASRRRPPLHHSEENFGSHRHSRSSISAESMYSQVTGHVRRMPDARQPIRDAADTVPPVPELKSKFSMSTIAASESDRRGRHFAKLKKKFNSGAGADGGNGNGGLFWK